jgi:glycosyltransferase involved in cell wall biosynthesis
VAISDAIFEELIGYGVPERRIARIPNGVDTDRFHPATDAADLKAARAELGWPDIPTIIFAGAITPRKRPHLLVEALAALRPSGIDAQLVLAGPVKDHVYGDQIRKIAAERKLSHRVIWTGFVPDLAPLYRAADFFALLSSNEGMPNALLEAMASGLPSVVTAIPGASDLVRNGEEAITVEPSISCVADALEQYIRSLALSRQHGLAARMRAVEKYSARRVLERHIRLYQRVIAGGDAAE